MVVSFKDPLMVLQVSWSWEALATLCAIKWLLSSVVPFMSLQHQMWKSSWHIWCTSMVVSFMDPVVVLQSSSLLIMRSSKYNYSKYFDPEKPLPHFVQLNGFSQVWFSSWIFTWNSCHICCTSMVVSFKDPLIVLQVSWSWKSLATLCAIEWFLFIVIPFMNCDVEKLLRLHWLLPSWILWWYF